MWITCVFISCLDSHSDGTHSLKRIHWWASDVMLKFSKSVPIEKETHLHLGWPEVRNFQPILIFGQTVPLTLCNYNLWKLTYKHRDQTHILRCMDTEKQLWWLFVIQTAPRAKHAGSQPTGPDKHFWKAFRLESHFLAGMVSGWTSEVVWICLGK